MNDQTAQMNTNSSDSSQDPQVQDPQVQDSQVQQPPETYADDYQPPIGASKADPFPGGVTSEEPSLEEKPSSDSARVDSEESLDSQNIFFMLGVEDGNEQLRDGFLNELQDVIWDDFLENDVSLLITTDEKVKFDSMMEKKNAVDANKNDEEIQDALVVYLESLIPDLEEIMLEKALDLKSDLFLERIKGLKEFHAENEANLAEISKAEKLLAEDKWRSASEVLNALKS